MIEKTKKLNVTAQKQIKQIKVGLVGDAGAGKSSFVTKYTQNTFKSSYEPTLGVQSSLKSIENTNGTITNITLWDFSGKLDFVEIRNQFYKEIDVLLVFCDQSSKSSVDSLDYWVREAKDNGASLVFVVGNKSDLKKSGQVESFGRDKGIPFFEISAKSGQGVQQLIKKVINEIK